MMRLSTMWRVDGTVRADRGSPVAERVLEPWAHDAGSVQFFRSSANFLYTFRSEGAPFFLRFADATERSREAIEAEVALLGWLAAAGIAVTLPVASRRGNPVETVETDRGAFHAVVFPAVCGEQREIDDLDGAGFRRWGAALGRLHAALREYPAAGPAAGPAARPSWRDLLETTREHVRDDEPAVRRELEEVAAALDALRATPETYGLIHFDFELDNLAWRDGEIAILDFDDCARLWFAADIAFALSDLFAEGADLADARVRAFLGGYAEHHPLDRDLRTRVPLFLRLGNLIRHARIARAMDLSVGPEHPDWLHGLSRKLQDQMAAYSASLEMPEA
jgi:Ser/Thr protein kinase RdoA (MazF antagonist)